MLKLSLLLREYFDISFKQMIKFVSCVATYETLWKRQLPYVNAPDEYVGYWLF